MSDYEAMIYEVADLARRIGPARTPADIRDRLEDIVAKHRKRAGSALMPDAALDEVSGVRGDLSGTEAAMEVIGNSLREARAETARLRKAMRRVIVSIQSGGDDIATGAEILCHALEATPTPDPPK